MALNKCQMMDKYFATKPCKPKLKSLWNKDDFVIGKQIGSGGFGNVFLVQHKSTAKQYAMKAIEKFKLRGKGLQDLLQREIDIQTSLSHPFIVHMHDSFEDNLTYYLILDIAPGGDLFEFMKLQPNGRFDNTLGAKYVLQLADALDYCHVNEVIHRDLKPNNLLLDGEGDLKLADFGLSIKSTTRRMTMCGTDVYMAPEIFLGEGYDYRVDIWSLGVLTFELLAGYLPFNEDEEDDDLEGLYEQASNIRSKFPNHFDEDAKQLLESLLQFNQYNRISLEEVIVHPWIYKYTDYC